MQAREHYVLLGLSLVVALVSQGCAVHDAIDNVIGGGDEPDPTPADETVRVVVHWQVSDGNKTAWKSIGQNGFTPATKTEAGVRYYGFTHSQDAEEGICREGYDSAKAFSPDHLTNVDAHLTAALAISSITAIEVHATEAQINDLKVQLAAFEPITTYRKYLAGASFYNRARQEAPNGCSETTCADTTVTLYTYWNVTDEPAFLTACESLVNLAKSGAAKYYNIAMFGNEAVVEEGFGNAADLISHQTSIAEALQNVTLAATKGKVEVHGPQQEAFLAESQLTANPRFDAVDGRFFVPAKYQPEPEPA